MSFCKAGACKKLVLKASAASTSCRKHSSPAQACFKKAVRRPSSIPNGALYNRSICLKPLGSKMQRTSGLDEYMVRPPPTLEKGLGRRCAWPMTTLVLYLLSLSCRGNVVGASDNTQ